MPPALLTDERISEALTQLPGWRRDGQLLRCELQLPSFGAAVTLTQRIAEVAEELNHHPEWTVRYRKVEVLTTTHDANGLTALDLQLATRIAALATAAGAIVGRQ